MSHDPNDERLREQFARLRAAESAATPGFRPPVPRSGRQRKVAWVAAAAAVALIGGAAWLLIGRQAEPSDPFAFDPSSAVWVAPTDFLLNTPGNDLLRSVPRIGLRPSAASSAAALTESAGTDTSTTDRRTQ